MCKYIKIWTDNIIQPEVKTFELFCVDYIARIEKTDYNKTKIQVFGYAEREFDVDAADVEAAIMCAENDFYELYERNINPKESI